MADYNINAVTRRVVFTGSAGLGPYSFTFEVLDQNDLAVYFNATLLTLTTDYTVTINANGTGSVTIVTGTNVPSTPTASDQIVIVGARDIERTTDFVTAGDLRASALNEQLDAQIIMIQQIAEENKRGMRAPVYDPALLEDGGVVDMELPTKASRAGKSLAFDSDGNPIAGEDIGNWRGDWAASVAYDVRDIVKDSVNSSIYRCNAAHTSSGTAPISGNADVAKWDLVIDATAVADAEAAQAAAEAAQAAAETAEANSATSETNSAASAASASTSASSASTSSATATTKAAEASTSAANASTSETNSAASEANAASSASSASTSSATATAQAGIATTKAGEASTSSATATTQAGISTTKAGEAATSASNAATSEANSATSETNAASSATAAAASQVSAAASAASAASAFDNFDDTYLGSYATDPTVDNDGDALVQGALYFNSTANEMRVYDGGSWIAASSAGGASLNLFEYTATAAQTTFSGADDNAATLSYTLANIIVTLNGITLDPSDYTATSGTSIVLASGAALNDELNIIAFKSFTTADMVSATNGGTFGGNVTVNGTLAATAVTGDGSGLTGLSSDLVDDTTPQLGGDLQSNGNDVVFADNDKAIFGAGSDLSISHNGSSSLIVDSGTGNLILACQDFSLTNPAVGENMITAAVDGAVTLFYDNAAKIATTSTGVSVTGTITATAIDVPQSSQTSIGATCMGWLNNTTTNPGTSRGGGAISFSNTIGDFRPSPFGVGTWRCHGAVQSGSLNQEVSVWQRIS